MPLSRVHTFAAKTIVDGAELDQEFDNIIAHHTAGHTSEDLAASAGVLDTQLAAKYEHMLVQFHVTAVDLDPALASGWPATTLVAAQSLPDVTGSTPWTATHLCWMCSAIGGGVGTFQIYWGTYAQVSAGAGTAIGGLQTINATSGSETMTTALAVGAAIQALGLYAVGADAAAVDTVATNFLNVAVRIRRPLATS